MKRMMKLLAAVMIAAVMTACASGAAGKYKMLKAEDSSGTVYDPQTLFGAAEVQVILYGDGTAELKKNTDSVSAPGSWDDTYLTIRDPYSGEELSGIYEIRNGELRWTISYYDSYYMRNASADIIFRRQ